MIRRWLKRRRQIRLDWQADAQQLIRENEHDAYYAAQRHIARSRANRDRKAFMHWAKVAAEVARLSPFAEMEITKVRQIADEELSCAHNTPGEFIASRPDSSHEERD